MLEIIVTAAVRAFLLSTLVLTGIALLRIRNVHTQKSLWTVVLLISAAMPLLMQWRAVAIPVAQLPVIGVYVSDLTWPTDSTIIRQSNLLLAIYLSVAALLTLRFLVGVVRALRLRNTARPVCLACRIPDEIRVSDALRAPATFGRTILLPTDFGSWSEEKLTAVIAHERAHVGDGDSYLRWLATLYCAVFWINPFAWWLKQRLAELAEHTSDAAALEQLPNPSTYIALLSEMATPRAPPPELIAMANRRTLDRRIALIVANTPALSRVRIWKRALGLVCLLPAIALLGNASLEQAASAAAPTEKHASPRVLSANGPMERWYPPEARSKGMQGFVTVSVTLDPAGKLVEAHVLKETPAGHGFGEASVAAAKNFIYANPTGQPVTTSFNVKFALND